MTPGLTTRVLAVVLRAYPESFRAQYARDMLVTLRDQRRAVSGTSRWNITTFWARVVADLLRSAAVERVACSRAGLASLGARAVLRIASGLLLLIFAVGNVAYDLSEPKLSMGVFAILLTALSALVGVRLVWWRRSLSV